MFPLLFKTAKDFVSGISAQIPRSMIPPDFGFREPAAQNVSAEISVSGPGLLQMFALNSGFREIFFRIFPPWICDELPPKAQPNNGEFFWASNSGDINT